MEENSKDKSETPPLSVRSAEDREQLWRFVEEGRNKGLEASILRYPEMARKLLEDESLLERYSLLAEQTEALEKLIEKVSDDVLDGSKAGEARVSEDPYSLKNVTESGASIRPAGLFTDFIRSIFLNVSRKKSNSKQKSTYENVSHRLKNNNPDNALLTTDVKAALKILGVSSNATIDEIKHRYRILSQRLHPDKPGGDAEQFMRVSMAYVTLKGGSGVDSSAIPDEVTAALHFRGRIDSDMQSVYERYLIFRNQLYADTKRYVEQAVNLSRSTSELKNVMSGQIKEHFVEVSAQLDHYIKTTCKHIPKQKEFLQDLFNDIYKNRRDLWLRNLYQHPIVLLTLMLIVARSLIIYYLNEKQIFPVLATTVSIWWIPFAFIGIVIIYFVGEYFLLAPRHQFIPPSLSIVGIDQWVNREMQKVRPTSSELATGGGFLGGAAALLFFPEPFTIIAGIVLGTLFGYGGRDLKEIKQDAIDGLMNEFTAALNQIDRGMKDWTDLTASKIYNAAVDSFGKNFAKVSAYLTRTMRQRAISYDK